MKNVFRQIRRELVALRRAHPLAATAVHEVERLLTALEHAGLRPTGRSRTGEQTSYRIERPAASRIDLSYACLLESRPGARPLRVPHGEFRSVVDALAQLERPVPFDDLMAAVTKATAGSRPSEWQVRVVLRFLLKATPPILRRSRSRYFPENPQSFSKDADNWWRRSAGT